MFNEFGYPPCCVKWFNNRMGKRIPFDLTYLQEKYCKHGFIPCPSCAEKLQRENMKLHQLIIEEKRTVNNSFPICNPLSDEQIQEQIEKRIKYKKLNESTPTVEKEVIHPPIVTFDFS